jgi:hypothetical protein
MALEHPTMSRFKRLQEGYHVQIDDVQGFCEVGLNFFNILNILKIKYG